jgi:mono/diheme cytochrome c family protein
MVHRAGIFLLLLAACPPIAAAQPAASPPAGAVASGHLLFVQSCSVCHLKPAPNAERYGPALSKETVDGREADVRDLIRDGSERMPGFAADLAPAQIDAIVQYLATVPPPSDASGASSPQQEMPR